MQPFQERIGRRVKELRMERHYNQRELALRVGWKPDYLSRFERGKWTQIDPGKLVILTEVLGVTPNDVIRRCDYIIATYPGDPRCDDSLA